MRPEITAKIAAKMGREDVEIINNGGFLLSMVANMIKTKIFGPSVVAKSYYVNEEYIATEKKNYNKVLSSSSSSSARVPGFYSFIPALIGQSRIWIFGASINHPSREERNSMFVKPGAA